MMPDSLAAGPAPEAGASHDLSDLQDPGAEVPPGSEVQTQPRSRRRWDVLAVSAATFFVLVLSGAEAYTWLYTPDSEFYLTLAAFGERVTARAPQDAYYWTKLGILAPQRLLTELGGYPFAHAAFRALLVLIITASGYAVARRRAPRSVSVLAALVLSLNTVVLGFLGDPYSTGAGIAAIAALYALLHRWPYTKGRARLWTATGMGVVAAWLVMIHPGFLQSVAPMAVVFMIGNLTVRARLTLPQFLGQLVVALAGFWAAFTTFVFAGTLYFPELSWVQTVRTWATQIDVGEYAPTGWHWLVTDTSLLVPLVCLTISGVVWAVRRKAELGVYTLAGATPVLITLATSRSGPGLEASFFNAILWPSSVLTLIAVNTSELRRDEDGGWVAWAGAGLATIGIVAAGHWSRVLPPAGALALAIVFAGLALWLVMALPGRRSWASNTITTILALAVLGMGFQVLQNARSAQPNRFPRIPYYLAYLGSPTEQVVDLDLKVGGWVLDSTAPTDRVAVWVAPGNGHVSQAAMALWGPNAVPTGTELTEWGLAHLSNLGANVVVVYANDRATAQPLIDQLSQHFATEEPVCRDFSAEAPPVTPPEAQGGGPLLTCIVRLKP